MEIWSIPQFMLSQPFSTGKNGMHQGLALTQYSAAWKSDNKLYNLIIRVVLSTKLYYEGCLMNKCQNGIILLVFRIIWKLTECFQFVTCLWDDPRITVPCLSYSTVFVWPKCRWWCYVREESTVRLYEQISVNAIIAAHAVFDPRYKNISTTSPTHAQVSTLLIWFFSYLFICCFWAYYKVCANFHRVYCRMVTWSS